MAARPWTACLPKGAPVAAARRLAAPYRFRRARPSSRMCAAKCRGIRQLDLHKSSCRRLLKLNVASLSRALRCLRIERHLLQSEPHTVVVGMDFSELSDEAFRRAYELASLHPTWSCTRRLLAKMDGSRHHPACPPNSMLNSSSWAHTVAMALLVGGRELWCTQHRDRHGRRQTTSAIG